jgi:hypothetical protein
MTDIERYVTPAELPTPYERELVTILIEEAAEVAQLGTKLLRFGAKETQPGQPDDNARRLAMEIGNLDLMVTMLVAHGMLNMTDIMEGRLLKVEQLQRFLQTRKP